MKIKKGKSFAIYVSSKVNDNVINFLNSQKNLSESIISIIEDHLSRTDSNDFYSLAKRVSILEEKVFGKTKSSIMNFSQNYTEEKVHPQNSEQPNNGFEQFYNHNDEILDEDSDMELLFKQLNE